MNYAQLLYALRGACRGWITLSDGRMLPPAIVSDLARDMLAVMDHRPEPFHDARVILLSQRPLTLLDQCVYAVIEVARADLLRRHELIDAVAHNALLLALASDRVDEYIVDLLALFPLDVLVEARRHLDTRIVMRDLPGVLLSATDMLDSHIAASRSSPDDIPPIGRGGDDVTEEPYPDDS